MDKRSIVALALIALIILAGGVIRARLYPPPPVIADSALVAPAAAVDPAKAVAAPPTSGTSIPATKARPDLPVVVAHADTETITLSDRVARFVNVGAAPVDVELPDYKDLKRHVGSLSIIPTRGNLMHFRIVNGADTIRLDDIAFTATQAGQTLEFASTSPAVRVKYQMTSDHFLTHATVSLAGAVAGAKLLVDLAPDLRSGEADTTEDFRHLAYGFKPAKRDVESIALQKLDTVQTTTEIGPLEWVAIRNKYFLYAVIAADSTSGFSQFDLRGGHRRVGNLATGVATATIAIRDNAAAFDLYTGPQSWTALRAAGHDLSNVNPYAGWAWLRPVVQPFATIVMRLLLWLKAHLNVSYGWVLVIFGLSIRMALWPLNQGAMRTSIRMQKLQPELAALQKKYAKDPEGQRQAMVKLYQDHDMSPFSPLMGCLPMLLPMPILFALYFVFQNTIEFRGVPFLWLPDISLRDPYYITPLIMGASMLVLSWIGMRVAPAGPQAAQQKVMGYMMPAVFTMMFLNFASGLNLYYAVQNLVAIPQQWFLTRERSKATAGIPSKTSPPLKPPR